MNSNIVPILVVIAVIVVVAIIIIAIVAGRQRKRRQEVAHRQEASALRDAGQQSDLSARAEKAEADQDRAEADKVRAEADKARVEAERLEQRADQRGHNAAVAHEDARDKLGTAEKLDPDAPHSGPDGPSATDTRGPADRAADPTAGRDRDEFGPRNP